MKARKVCLYSQLLLLLVIVSQMPALGIVYVRGGGHVDATAFCVNKGQGLSNLGLLVKSWGKVTDKATSPYPYFTIDDGSRVGVRVRVLSSGSLPAIGQVVFATGISTICQDAKGNKCRVIRVRRDSDIISRQ